MHRQATGRNAIFLSKKQNKNKNTHRRTTWNCSPFLFSVVENFSTLYMHTPLYMHAHGSDKSWRVSPLFLFGEFILWQTVSSPITSGSGIYCSTLPSGLHSPVGLFCLCLLDLRIFQTTSRRRSQLDYRFPLDICGARPCSRATNHCNVKNISYTWHTISHFECPFWTV